MKTVRLLVAIAALVLLLPTSLRASELAKAHPDLAAKLPGIKAVLVLPPRISMYEIGAGGTPEKMEDWSTAAQANVSQAFSARPPALATIRLSELDENSLAPAARETYDETRLLYEVVASHIVNHTYDTNRPWYFPAKASKFVYSLGPGFDEIAPEAEALLLIEGFDHRTTSGRKALQAGTMLIGLVLGAVVIPRGAGNLMTVALVEAKTGTILWFYRTQYSYDLREPSSAAAFAEDVLKELTAPGE
jgi:hypothetical protein